MTTEEALKLARDWVAVRKEVRRTLIDRALERNPIDAGRSVQDYSSDVRKLHHYAFDLSEERLIRLIDNPPAIESKD
jgi:hypothetical protein